MKYTKQDFIDRWTAFQKAKQELDECKEYVIDQIDVKGEKVGGFYLTVSYRPVFSGVSLETARKFDAVKKVVNTTKLSEVLKTGAKIDGVEYSKYINVKTSFK